MFAFIFVLVVFYLHVFLYFQGLQVIIVVDKLISRKKTSWRSEYTKFNVCIYFCYYLIYISYSCCFLHVSLVSGFTGHPSSHERSKKREARKEKQEKRSKKREARKEKQEKRSKKREERKEQLARRKKPSGVCGS
jgi:hypothetical protein